MMPSQEMLLLLHKRPQLNLKPQLLWDNAVLATVVQQVQSDKLVAMDEMVLMVCPASLVIVDPQLHQPQSWCPKSQISAHAKHHQEMLVPQDQKDPMDHPEMLAHQVLMANQEIKDPADHPAHQAQLELPETKDLLEILARSLAQNQVQLVHPVQLANQAPLALQANQVMPVRTAIQAVQAQLATLVLQAVPAKLAAQVAQETPVKPAHQAAANTAHQLVWLQVIKHRWSLWLDNILHYPNRDTYSSFPHTNQFGITAQLNAFSIF